MKYFRFQTKAWNLNDSEIPNFIVVHRKTKSCEMIEWISCNIKIPINKQTNKQTTEMWIDLKTLRSLIIRTRTSSQVVILFYLFILINSSLSIVCLRLTFCTRQLFSFVSSVMFVSPVLLSNFLLINIHFLLLQTISRPPGPKHFLFLVFYRLLNNPPPPAEILSFPILYDSCVFIWHLFLKPFPNFSCLLLLKI